MLANINTGLTYHVIFILKNVGAAVNYSSMAPEVWKNHPMFGKSSQNSCQVKPIPKSRHQRFIWKPKTATLNHFWNLKILSKVKNVKELLHKK